MIDYLERLLERLQEDENLEHDALRLDADAKSAPPPKNRTGGKAAPQPAGPLYPRFAAYADKTGSIGAAFHQAASAIGSAVASAASLISAPAAAAARSDAAPDLPAPYSPSDSAADALASAAPSRAGVSLDRSLDRVVDVLDYSPGGSPYALELSAATPRQTASFPYSLSSASPQWPAPSAAGSAALPRRLSDAALAVPPPPAQSFLALDSDQLSPSADWDEFDRRLERDARRYDGGVHLF